MTGHHLQLITVILLHLHCYCRCDEDGESWLSKDPGDQEKSSNPTVMLTHPSAGDSLSRYALSPKFRKQSLSVFISNYKSFIIFFFFSTAAIVPKEGTEKSFPHCFRHCWVPQLRRASQEEQVQVVDNTRQRQDSMKANNPPCHQVWTAKVKS